MITSIDVFVFLAKVCLCIGLFWSFVHFWLMLDLTPKGYIKTQGKIKDYEALEHEPSFFPRRFLSRLNKNVFNPLIIFSYQGQDYIFKGASETLGYNRRSGTKVSVAFDPHNPEDAVELKSFFTGFWAPVLCIFFSAGILVLTFMLTQYNLTEENQFLIIAGFIFSGIGLVMLFSYPAFRTNGLVGTTGVITGYKAEEVPMKGIFYFAKITFYNISDNEKIEFVDTLYPYKKNPLIGKKVKILFNPANPKEARLHTPRRFLYPAVPFLIGGGMILSGIGKIQFIYFGFLVFILSAIV